MREREILQKIGDRFRLDSYSLRKLKGYEYELIYNAFPELSRDEIMEAFKKYKEKKFTLTVFMER